mgnify:CR=1 FL=1
MLRLRREWAGLCLALGLVGICLVLGSKLEFGSSLFSGFGMGALVSVLAALLGISLGTLYQKPYCTSMPLLSGAVIQYLAAGTLLGLGVAAALLAGKANAVRTYSTQGTLAAVPRLADRHGREEVVSVGVGEDGRIDRWEEYGADGALTIARISRAKNAAVFDTIDW